MKINVYVDKLNKDYVFEVRNVDEIFEKLKLKKDLFIIVRSNELINEKIELRNGDEIKLLSVISGG